MPGTINTWEVVAAVTALVAALGWAVKRLNDEQKKAETALAGYLEFAKSAAPILADANRLLAEVREVIKECSRVPRP